jgi:integrase
LSSSAVSSRSEAHQRISSVSRQNKMKSKCIFQIGPLALEHGVPANLLGCPFILTPSGYPNNINQYLQEFWLGKWHNEVGYEEVGAAHVLYPTRPKLRYRPSASSVQEMANRLLNLLNWCEEYRRHPNQISIDPVSISEDDIDRYARQMESGLWSSDGRPLATSTIRQRQVSAIGFRLWATARGHSNGIKLTTALRTVAIGVTSGAKRRVNHREYAVVRRADPTTIQFPTEQDVDKSIQEIEDIAVLLGAKLVYFCGLRREEVCNITVHDVSSTRGGLNTQRFISVLGKGRKRRNVEIDEDLLAQIHDYIEFERPIRLHRHRTNSESLLISDNNGRPFAPRQFWSKLRSANQEISPHLGRHWYAIMYLLRAWRSHELRARQGGLILSTNHIPSLLSLDLIRLQQNLGHASIATTQRYLVALSQYIDKAELSMSFQDMIGAKGC